MWNLMLKKYGDVVNRILEEEEREHTANTRMQKTADMWTTAPWSRSRSAQRTLEEQQDELEQELIAFYAIVKPERMEQISKIVQKHFHHRATLETQLMR